MKQTLRLYAERSLTTYLADVWSINALLKADNPDLIYSKVGYSSSEGEVVAGF